MVTGRKVMAWTKRVTGTSHRYLSNQAVYIYQSLAYGCLYGPQFFAQFSSVFSTVLLCTKKLPLPTGNYQALSHFTFHSQHWNPAQDWISAAIQPPTTDSSTAVKAFHNGSSMPLLIFVKWSNEIHQYAVVQAVIHVMWLLFISILMLHRSA